MTWSYGSFSNQAFCWIMMRLCVAKRLLTYLTIGTWLSWQGKKLLRVKSVRRINHVVKEMIRKLSTISTFKIAPLLLRKGARLHCAKQWRNNKSTWPPSASVRNPKPLKNPDSLNWLEPLSANDWMIRTFHKFSSPRGHFQWGGISVLYKSSGLRRQSHPSCTSILHSVSYCSKLNFSNKMNKVWH